MTKSAEVTNEPVVINVTKIKQWYIVADVQSYAELKKMGVPMLRIHQNFLPTFQLLKKKWNFRIKSQDFEDSILDPFMDKVGETWVRKYGTCTMTSKVLVFQARNPDKIRDAKEAVPKLEEKLLSFFNRWGYKCNFQYSEGRDGLRLKFHVEYWFDNDKMPVLPLETPTEQLKPVVLKIGFTRISLSFDPMNSKDRKIGYVHLKIETSQGGKWQPIHTTKCLPTQFSSVLPMLNALMGVVNLDPHNLDNEAE
jgi:hypothetical protein